MAMHAFYSQCDARGRYLGNECLKLAEDYHPLFAFEEAIGYLHGTEIKDKDGVSRLNL